MNLDLCSGQTPGCGCMFFANTQNKPPRTAAITTADLLAAGKPQMISCKITHDKLITGLPGSTIRNSCSYFKIVLLDFYNKKVNLLGLM